MGEFLKLFGVLAILFVSYAFAKIQGGFLPWFLFGFLLILALYEIISYAVGVRGVSTERRLSAHRLTAGQALTVEIIGRRRGWWPLFWLRITDDLPRHWLFQAAGADRVLQPLWAREFKLTYTLSGLQRGVHRIGDTTVETGDLLGLVHRRRRHRRSDEVIVFPRVVPVRGWSGYRPEQLGLRQPTRRRSEESTNVLGVRDYIPGDRLSRIHWPASARKGALQAKEFELHVASELVFVPDLSVATFQGKNPALFELEMTVVASLLKYSYELRRTFSAVLHGARLMQFPAGCDEALLLRCMEALAMAEPNGRTDFTQTLTRVAQETPVGTTLVVVSPRIDRAAAIATEAVRRRNAVEWFVPMLHTTLSADELQNIAVLQSARAVVHLIASLDQLGRLHRGGVHRVTEG